MELKEYWNNHSSIIEIALSDYLRWFEDHEENYYTIKQALNEINEVEY